jgi:glycosyltransferase involved in cell wall biosynthesis
MNTTGPLVSIITPAYNAERFLAETIASVRTQTYTHWEYIIVNDGSKDGTLEIARKLAEEDPRIRVIDQPNKGVSTARNNGFADAKGEYLALLDADDTWEPDNLSVKVAELEAHAEIDWVFSDMYLCEADMGNPEPHRALKRVDLVRAILLWEGDIVPGPSSNIVLRRRCYDEGIQFDPRFSTAADQDFCLQLARKYRAKHIPELLWNYRVIANSMSRNVRVMEVDHIGVYKKAAQSGLYGGSRTFRNACFAQLYLILAGSWWGPGRNKLRSLQFAFLAVWVKPSTFGVAVQKFLRRLTGKPYRRKHRSVLVLTYWSWPDALIQTYTLPYLRQMRSILPETAKLYLFTLEQKPMTVAVAEEVRQKLLAEGIHWLPVRYQRFGPQMAMRLAGLLPSLLWLCLRERFQAIHCWCMPAGAIGWFLSVVTRTPLYIDSYEPHAEAMVENGTWARGGFRHRVLAWFERRLTHRAEVLISCTEGYLKAVPKLFDVNLTGKRVYVKPACTDLQLFRPDIRKHPSLMQELGYSAEHIVAVYAGKFGGIYLTTEVFTFLKACETKWGSRFRALLLTNYPTAELQGWIKEAGLAEDAVQIRFVPHQEVPRYIGLADFALTPVKPLPSKRYCTPIKDGEYWALGLPVAITPHISDDSDIILQEHAGVIFEPNKASSIQQAVEQLDVILAEPTDSRIRRIRAIAERYRNFEIARAIYWELYK